jgi:hypothetical protein
VAGFAPRAVRVVFAAAARGVRVVAALRAAGFAARVVLATFLATGFLAAAFGVRVVAALARGAAAFALRAAGALAGFAFAFGLAVLAALFFVVAFIAIARPRFGATVESSVLMSLAPLVNAANTADDAPDRTVGLKSCCLARPANASRAKAGSTIVAPSLRVHADRNLRIANRKHALYPLSTASRVHVKWKSTISL